ncbi:MAG: alcohol dehydrogenase catalytic domain-containing protein, partial [Planctomycetales bacterium]|nr:alcohol dehydrogenase catalytic domain-containing protein [Planctomycetales bacterium]
MSQMSAAAPTPGRTQRGIAARVGSQHATFVDIPAPAAPGPGEALCRTLELGICGTDREIIEAAQPFTPAGEDFLVLGHECLAEVVDVGPEVRGFKPGDLVVPTVRRRLGPSPCRIDLLSMGQYTERGIVRQHGFSAPLWVDPVECLLPVEPELAGVAVLTEPQSVAEKAFHEALAAQRARLGPDAWTDPPPRVLITGMGPIAFAGLLAAAARGWPATLLGRDAAGSPKVETALAWGGRYLHVNDFDAAPADLDRDGFDLLLECTGDERLLVEAAGARAPRGVSVWLAAARRQRETALDWGRFLRQSLVRNHIHIGSVNAAPRDLDAALAHLRRFHQTRPNDLAALIT